MAPPFTPSSTTYDPPAPSTDTDASHLARLVTNVGSFPRHVVLEVMAYVGNEESSPTANYITLLADVMRKIYAPIRTVH
jgi:hypothetical protein